MSEVHMDPVTRERYDVVHSAIMDGPYAHLQHLIDNGTVWRLEGSMGRQAMDALEQGACILGLEAHEDYYGTPVPAFYMVEDVAGSPGSLANAEWYIDNYEPEKAAYEPELENFRYE